MNSLMMAALVVASCRTSELPPEPSAHLTPPQAASKPDDAEVVASAPVPSPRGLRLDGCSPCDRVPWVPMARALTLDSQQYALSVPAVPINLPISYGIPVSRFPPQAHQEPSPPQQVPPSGPQQVNNGVHHAPTGPHLVPTAPQGLPPPLPPPSQYGHGPGTNDVKHNLLHDQFPSPQDEKAGLPPPPLPQRFTYGPPQPPTQHVSESVMSPMTTKYHPPLMTPSPFQLFPNMKYGSLFNVRPPTNPNPLKPPSNYFPTNPSTPHAGRYVNQGLPQNQDTALRKPIINHNPSNDFPQIQPPFPQSGRNQLPTFLTNYQNNNDGKRDQLYPYLQPPKPQNVVVTITETDDNCKKCQGQSHVNDSEPAQAEPVTENILKPKETFKTNNLQHINVSPQTHPHIQQKPNVQVVKSVPLAEYLASVEYPMQIIQAPILDVPDLTKYFSLGYHNFAPIINQHGNSGYKLQDQHQAQTFEQPNKQNLEHYIHDVQHSYNASSFKPSSTTALDDVSVSETQTPITVPVNHKPILDTLGKNEESTEKDFISSSTLSQSLTTLTRPSQIFHISKVPARSTHKTDHSKHTTTELPFFHSSVTSSGHFVTSQPTSELQPPSTAATPAPFHDLYAHSLTASSEGRFPTGNANLHLSEPPVGPGTFSDWSLYPFGRGWGNTPPQPFVMPPAPSHRARFEVRPTPAPSKKAKNIHQIIVPYTTNKHASPLVPQDPQNTFGWTPVPPTNQGRKVPSSTNSVDQFPSTTGLDQVRNYYATAPSASSHVDTNVPLSASGTDNLGSHQIPPPGSGNSFNLPPHIINHILSQNQGAIWPTGPDSLQQLLSENLQSLLRGEENSIDIARLQKNIDNWTAEGYKQNSPPVNYIPVTTISHVFNSKNIPEEYLTSTEAAISNNSSQEKYSRHRGSEDSEGAASLRHQIEVPAETQTRDSKSEENLEKSTLPSLFEEVSSEPTSKAWEKIQVSISPLTKEKVYVVTPVPATATEEALSSEVERSNSLVTGETHQS